MPPKRTLGYPISANRPTIHYATLLPSVTVPLPRVNLLLLVHSPKPILTSQPLQQFITHTSSSPNISQDVFANHRQQPHHQTLRLSFLHSPCPPLRLRLTCLWILSAGEHLQLCAVLLFISGISVFLLHANDVACKQPAEIRMTYIDDEVATRSVPKFSEANYSYIFFIDMLFLLVKSMNLQHNAFWAFMISLFYCGLLVMLLICEKIRVMVEKYTGDRVGLRRL